MKKKNARETNMKWKYREETSEEEKNKTKQQTQFLFAKDIFVNLLKTETKKRRKKIKQEVEKKIRKKLFRQSLNHLIRKWP